MHLVTAFPYIIKKNLTACRMLYKVMIILEKIISKYTLRRAATCTYFKTRHLAHTVAVKIDRLCIPTPAGYFIVCAVISDLFYFTTIDRHNKNISIIILPAGECDPFTVRRNTGRSFITLHGSKTGSIAVIYICFPEIALKSKDDRLSVRGQRGI